MDFVTLRSLALRAGGYSTPRLNDSLHANAAGLVSFVVSREDDGDENENNNNASSIVSPLAAYSSLKSLHLSDNGFETLRGMPLLEELKCLFIERNCLTTLRGLSRAAPSLSTLDASGNRLTEVSVESGGRGGGGGGGDGNNAGCLPRTLTTLRLSGNDFSAPGALDGLFVRKEERGEEGDDDESENDAADADAADAADADENNNKSTSPSSSSSSSLLPHLSTLDLSHCSISDSDAVLVLVESLPSLRALYLQGNPFWDEMRLGRSGGGGSGEKTKKTTTSSRRSKVGARLAVLAAASQCMYLNDSPVFGDERAAADAFRASGGCAEAAAAAREAFLDAAAAEAEKTTRLLERPPRFSVVEERADEEGGEGDSGDENDDEKKKAERGDEAKVEVKRGE